MDKKPEYMENMLQTSSESTMILHISESIHRRVTTTLFEPSDFSLEDPDGYGDGL